MAWLTANWFSVVIFIAFIAMHLFGHSGHGGHGGGNRQQGRGDPDKRDAQGRPVTTSAGGHQH